MSMESVLNMLKSKFDYKVVTEKIEEFIRASVENFGKDGAILGMSGGLDSTVVATLCVRALGEDKVFALILPERDSEPENI